MSFALSNRWLAKKIAMLKILRIGYYNNILINNSIFITRTVIIFIKFIDSAREMKSKRILNFMYMCLQK